MLSSIKKIIGYILIGYGVLLIPSGLFGGIFIGTMATDSGDTSYFGPVMIGTTLACFALAFLFIKIGLKLKEGKKEVLDNNDVLDEIVKN